jgi:hypothetical protein
VKPAELQRLKRDFIAALRIIHRQGLSDAFAHVSARLDGGQKMLFMPRKSRRSHLLNRRAWKHFKALVRN